MGKAKLNHSLDTARQASAKTLDRSLDTARQAGAKSADAARLQSPLRAHPGRQAQKPQPEGPPTDATTLSVW